MLTPPWLQDVKLAGVSRLEGQPLNVPLAVAEPTPEASASGDNCLCMLVSFSLLLLGLLTSAIQG